MIERTAIVAEARSWIGTPYVKRQCVKGSGADCATLIVGIYRGVGLIGNERLHDKRADWFWHTQEETYFLRALRHAHKIVEGICSRRTAGEPGSIALAKVCGSHVYNHGGIVTKWPMVVHAAWDGVHEVNALLDPMWAYKQVVILDPNEVANV